MSAGFPGFRRIVGSIAVLVLGALTFSGAVAAAPPASTGCIAARVADPVEMPDGSVYPAGSVSICSTRAFSPIAALHRVAVGGVPVGVLMSRSAIAEGEGVTEPMVMFRRADGGNLQLVGYAWPAGGRSRVFVVRDSERRELTARTGSGAARPTGGGGTLLVAAQAQ